MRVWARYCLDLGYIDEQSVGKTLARSEYQEISQ